MKLRKEFIIGVVASFTLVAFYWGFSYLKGNDIFSKEREFVLVYEKVAGLTVSNPVTVNGLKVGKVSYVNFIPNDPKANILVKIKLTNDILIPASTIAVIKSDFLGVNTIELQFSPSTIFAKSGDTLKTNVATTIQEEVSMQMLPIKLKAEQMMSSLDSVLGAIKYIFNEETQQSLANTFISIKATISNLEHTSMSLDTIVSGEKNRLNRIFANVEGITENLSSNSKEIDNIINNFSDISDSLAKADIQSTLYKMDKAMGDFQLIVDRINRGEGSLGQLVNNDSLYNELESSATQLHELLEDIKLNPKRYVKVSVFGGKKNDPYVNPKELDK